MFHRTCGHGDAGPGPGPGRVGHRGRRVSGQGVDGQRELGPPGEVPGAPAAPTRRRDMARARTAAPTHPRSWSSSRDTSTARAARGRCRRPARAGGTARRPVIGQGLACARPGSRSLLGCPCLRRRGRGARSASAARRAAATIAAGLLSGASRRRCASRSASDSICRLSLHIGETREDGLQLGRAFGDPVGGHPGQRGSTRRTARTQSFQEIACTHHAHLPGGRAHEDKSWRAMAGG